MIELTLLEQLAAFEEYGTLSKAAEMLHTSQPALTRSMKKLEEELGVVLFERKKNRMGLTPTGKTAVRYARRVLQSAEDFSTQVIQFDRSQHTIHIGFCAPIPQQVLTPVLNNIFQDMTISADMKSDQDFLTLLQNGTYQLAVLHEKPDDALFYSKKIGHEDLYLNTRVSDPLAFYPEVHLSDLENTTMLLLNRIGFWMDLVMENIPNPHFIIQYEQDSFDELARLSDLPVFTTDYYIKRSGHMPGRLDIPIADSACHTDYYLTCLKEREKEYRPLFRQVNENSI